MKRIKNKPEKKYIQNVNNTLKYRRNDLIKKNDNESKNINIKFVQNKKIFKEVEIEMKNNLSKRISLSKIYFFIFIFLLNINGILTDSFITLKINKSGMHKIFFNGGIQDADNECNDNIIQNYLPSSMTINNEVFIGSIYSEYDFTNEENTIQLNFSEQKINYKCLFYGCSDIIEIDLSHFNTSKLENMESMFNGCSSLTSINLNNFDTSKVTSMAYMFRGCSSLKYLDLSNFDTSNVTDMSFMFYKCSSLTSIIISSFNTKIVYNMRSMFGFCTSLSSLDVSNFNTQSVLDIADMFEECRNLTSLNLLNFNTLNVEVMDGIFKGCSSLISLNLSNFRTSKVTWMSNMFSECSSIVYLDLSNFNTSSVEYFHEMFKSCTSLISLNLSNFNTRNTKYMNAMFENCFSLKYLDISNFNTSSVINMGWMFCNCFSLESLNILEFNTKNVTNMRMMFASCISLTTLDLSNFDTSNVKDMGWMFSGCRNLTILDLSKFITSLTTQFEYMFYGCKSLKSLYIQNLHTSNAKNFEYMFYGCSSLTFLDLSHFDTSEVTDMFAMFAGCSSLTSIMFGNFNMPNVFNMSWMFERCSSLKYLDLSSFTNQLVINTSSMFSGCYSLTSLILSNLNTSQVTDMKFMFDGCSNLKYMNLNNMKIQDNVLLNRTIDKNLINPTICIGDLQSFDKILSFIESGYVNCSSNWGVFFNITQNNRNNLCLNNHLLSKYDSNYNDNNNNCYEICSYYFYYDNNKNKYICIESLECPSEYNKLIHGKNECVKSCEETKEYKYIFEYEFGTKCLKSCPENFINLQEKPDSCKDECPKETPFLLIETLKCVSECTIKQRQNKLCITSYVNTNEDDFNVINIIKDQTINELKSNFDKSVVNGNPINENGITIKITKTNQKNNTNNNFGECEKLLKDNHSISLNESLYLLIIETQRRKMSPIIEYEAFYPLDGKNLGELDLSICENGSLDIICPKNKSKLIEEKNECIESCDKDDNYQFEFRNKCYKECPLSTVSTNNNKCDLICSKEYPYEMIDTQECVKSCNINDIIINKCKLKYTNSNNKKNETKPKEKLSTKIMTEILNGNFNYLLNDIITNISTGISFEDGNDRHQISRLSKNSDDDIKGVNYTSIYFGECEDLIKNEYNIKDEELIIYQIEHYNEGFNIPILEYVIFTQNGSVNLSLNVCNNVTVKYKIPVNVSKDEIYKYDPNDDYYNNECNKYSTNGNVDMTLYDRKNDYNNKNLSLCESGCQFLGYNATTSKAICDCKIKKDMSYSNDDGNLLSKMDSVKSNSNLGVTKCIKELVQPENIKSNGGFYSILIVIVVFIIVFIIFCLKGKSMIENKIDETIYKTFHKKGNNVINDEKKKSKHLNNKPIKQIINHKKSSKKKKSDKTEIKKEEKSMNSKNILNVNKKDNLINNKSIKNKIQINKNPTNLNNINNNKNIEEQYEYKPDKDNDYELNNLSYQDALKFDKRECCDYYISLIKNKQLFAFTFCSFNDYNSGIIRKFIFFLSFALHYTVNTLFFNDSNMHQIYEDEGKYNFSYQLPKILISALSSTVILRIMLETLVLTDKNILIIRLQKTKEEALRMKRQVLKCVNIKFALFFVINFLLLILFWIYLTCWNGKYENTQVYLIENTMISFGFSLSYPFVINIIPSVLRMISLDRKAPNKECIYTTSKIIQIL